MKIVITPAKRMNDNIDYIDVESLPVFLPQTEELLGILKTLKVDEVKKMLGCNCSNCILELSDDGSKKGHSSSTASL